MTVCVREPPHASVLKRKPRYPDDFIITREMSRLIFGIGGVFLVILIAFLLVMPTLPGGNPETQEQKEWLTIFFCVFVLLQFWNLFNARCLGRNESAFVGLFQNKAFLLIAGVILFGQIVLVQFFGNVFRTVPLSWAQWGVIIAATSPVLVIGEVIRFVARAKARATTPPDAETG